MLCRGRLPHSCRRSQAYESRVIFISQERVIVTRNELAASDTNDSLCDHGVCNERRYVEIHIVPTSNNVMIVTSERADSPSGSVKRILRLLLVNVVRSLSFCSTYAKLAHVRDSRDQELAGSHFHRV
jgi:hypothetical protein